jgi:hypothetical protein
MKKKHFYLFPRSFHNAKNLSTEKTGVIHRKPASYPQALGIRYCHRQIKEKEFHLPKGGLDKASPIKSMRFHPFYIVQVR